MSTNDAQSRVKNRLRPRDGRCRRYTFGVVVVSLATVLAACGSTSSGDTSNNADGGEGLTRAQAVVEQATVVPETIAVTDPIGQPIPGGKRIAYISCGVPACNTQAEIATEAGKELGWSVTTIQATSAPADVQNAMQQAIRDNYDGVMYAGFTKEAFRRELAQLEAKNVPVVAVSTEDPVGDGITAVIRAAEEGTASGALAADYIITQSNGSANVGLINLPAFRTIDIVAKGFESALAENCPGCTFVEEDLPNSVFTKGDGPSRVVAFLRANPEVDWLFLSNDALAVGLPAALQAAGLADRVKIGGTVAGTTNMAMIREGQQAFTVPTPLVDIVWQQTDAIARALAGVPVEASMKPTPRFIWTSETLPTDISSFPPIVPGLEEQFLELWGK